MEQYFFYEGRIYTMKNNQKERNDEILFGADIKDDAERKGVKSKEQERDDELYFGAKVLEKEDIALNVEEQERADEIQFGAKVKK